MTWPSRSTDLNPTGHLENLKRKLEQQNPSSKEKMKRITRKEWQDISPQICGGLVSSMPRRSESVNKNKEGHDIF